MKITKKQMEMIKKVLLLLLLIVFGFFLCSLVFKKEKYSNYDSEGSKRNQIENFLFYPNEQKFCPNIYNSMSSFWNELPPEYSNNLLCKFCCTSCYFKISEEIICGENKTGDYKICTLEETDIDNLQQYYNKEQKNLDFGFPSLQLFKLKGSNVLKMKHNGVYYPIQILKTKEELKKHEENATIATFYRESNLYKCK